MINKNPVYTSMSEEELIKLFNAEPSFEYVTEILRECSTYLDRTYGYVLGGSPLLTDNIKAHYKADPDRRYAKYAMTLIEEGEELLRSIEEERRASQ